MALLDHRTQSGEYARWLIQPQPILPNLQGIRTGEALAVRYWIAYRFDLRDQLQQGVWIETETRADPLILLVPQHAEQLFHVTEVQPVLE